MAVDGDVSLGKLHATDGARSDLRRGVVKMVIRLLLVDYY